jgi:hypothetical protein
LTKRNTEDITLGIGQQSIMKTKIKLKKTRRRNETLARQGGLKLNKKD